MDPYTTSAPDPYADNYSAPPPAPATNEGRSPLPPVRGRSRSASPPRNNGSEYRSERNGGRSPRRPSHAPAAPTPSNVLGVFGLSIRSQERDLDDEFSRFGRVEKVTIVYDQRSGRSRGFGFIRMATVEDASKCVQELNGTELNGRRIRVDFSVTERPHNPTPGEYMGHRRSGGEIIVADATRTVTAATTTANVIVTLDGTMVVTATVILTAATIAIGVIAAAHHLPVEEADATLPSLVAAAAIPVAPSVAPTAIVATTTMTGTVDTRYLVGVPEQLGRRSKKVKVS